MNIGLFLGAGASVSYDKPATEKFKKMLLEKYPPTNFRNHLMTSLLSVPEFTDIEYVLQSIKDIKEFSKSKGNSFFSYIAKSGFQHQMLAYQSQGYSYDQIMNELGEINNIIEDEIFRTYSWNHDKDHDLNAVMFELIGVLMKESERIRIFTTNYDRAVEEYASENGYQILDGFRFDVSTGRFLWIGQKNYHYEDENRYPTDFDFKKKNIYLYKLHGSLNWKQHKKHGIVKVDFESKPADPNFEKDYLIYPTLSPKDGQELEPYMTIRDEFIEALGKIDVCVVIGFSFRDQHITEKFRDFVNRRDSYLVVVSPTAYHDVQKYLLEENIIEEKVKEEITEAGGRAQITCVNKPITPDNAYHIAYDDTLIPIQYYAKIAGIS